MGARIPPARAARQGPGRQRVRRRRRLGGVVSGLGGWSTSRAGRLEPLVEPIATTQYLAAAASVKLEAIENP
ncbi:hypothetical protein GCM10010503_38140 [Streptomyces lucensis JCM 4490]|uniref:Uncharacterized protein n=1 Tax=Streptomyces lucensis JCM 4490 TaxID=1306176 RepID=A0A918MSV8_9ACTN|nr:hypothetical protein GCM10010503_38140 [Streptomyces lucensis JCM 4490]